MEQVDGRALDRLFGTIQSRMGGNPEESYTAKLFARGRKKIAQKLGEEAVETVIAALAETPDHVVKESADLLFHLMTLWADCGITPDQVWRELESRRQQSGLDEKKSRNV